MPRDDETPFINRSNPRFPPVMEADKLDTQSQSRGARWPYVLAVVLLVALGWALRWETVTTGDRDSSVFFMVNRWTGEIRVVFPHGYETVPQDK
ncbi:MAG: hypothetical protein LCH79_15405 [Proteobacteria bacterium]|nr:hypothetical protein [Pseudomonadota bacterium]